jgi:hypothetical protein
MQLKSRLTLNDENACLRDERDQFVERIDELQTGLNEIISSDVVRQVQDLQEQVQLGEMENTIEVTTMNDENEILRLERDHLQDEREQFVDRISKSQADLYEITSSDVTGQVQELQEHVHVLDRENGIIHDDKQELMHS